VKGIAKTVADLNAIMQKEHGCDNTPGLKIDTGGKTFKQEDEALKKLSENKGLKQVEQYNAYNGPNSNTYAHQLLLNAGFPDPTPPAGARGWNYNGFYSYGGDVYDKNGVPRHNSVWKDKTGEWRLPNGDYDPDGVYRFPNGDLNRAKKEYLNKTGSMGIPGCFVAGTKVITDSGIKAIEDVRTADRVLSWNPKSRHFEFKSVVRLIRAKKRELILIQGDGWILLCTAEHPFLVGEEWVVAGKLAEGNLLKDSNGSSARINCITKLTSVVDVDVFNFTVQDNHSYCVGDLGIVVHNK
jgi:hypothetical protein